MSKKTIIGRFALMCGFVLHACSLLALDVKEVIAKTASGYRKAERMEYSCKYELFKGHGGEDLISSYSGYFYKDGEMSYQKAGPAEYVYGKDFFLVISHEEKEMNLFKAVKTSRSDVDAEAMLKASTSHKMEEKTGEYQIELTYGPTSSSPFSSIVLSISKSDYNIRQIDIFYADQQDFAGGNMTSDMAAAHLRMTFSDVDLKAGRHDKLLVLSNYLEDQGGKLAVNALYTGYTVQDNRQK